MCKGEKRNEVVGVRQGQNMNVLEYQDKELKLHVAENEKTSKT